MHAPVHATNAQVAGGDQIYADAVLELPSLKPWLAIDDPAVRAREPFTGHMLQEVEQYYWGHYCRHFSDPAFGPALASIPYHYSWGECWLRRHQAVHWRSPCSPHSQHQPPDQQHNITPRCKVCAESTFLMPFVHSVVSTSPCAPAPRRPRHL
jgi:hypothetical protein